MTRVPSKHGIFSMKSAWFAIREVDPRQEWCDVVWFKKYTPRWVFILWLAILQKLSTKDRTLTWGIIPDATCVLYTHGSVESHNHLFFECPYSSR